MKQTAIEFLVNEFKQKLMGDNLPEWVEKIIEQAKAMEKEQMIQVAMYHRDSCVERACIESYINKYFKSE